MRLCLAIQKSNSAGLILADLEYVDIEVDLMTDVMLQNYLNRHFLKLG